MKKLLSQTSAIQIVDNPRDPEQLVVRRVRRFDGPTARVFASSLDRQLAAGRSPESSQLLATRAAQLASARMRRKLARNLDHLLDLVNRAPTVRGPRVLVPYQSIKEVEPELREMLTKLATPTSARGVAMARALLSDGTGPLFNRHSSTNLRDAIHHATAQLDRSGSAGESLTLSR